MKKIQWPILCSLGLNLAFVIAAWQSHVELKTGRRRSALPQAATAIEPASAARKIWEGSAGLRGPELRDWLRAQGFPDYFIRGLLEVQTRAAFAERQRAISAKLANIPFWKNSKIDADVQKQLRQLTKEVTAAVDAIMGPDPIGGELGKLHRVYPTWPDARLAALAAIENRFNQQRQDVQNEIRGTYAPGDYQKLQAIQNEMHVETAALLSPEELDDYDLKFGQTANSLRARLSAFDTTEPEFLSLYKLQSAFDRQFPSPYGPVTADEAKVQDAARQQLNIDIASALAPDRYAEYQKTQDRNYQQTALLVARLEAPPESASTLYNLQKEYQQRATMIRQAATDPATRAALPDQLAALQQEAAARISSVFNDNADAIDAYKQYGGGWINNIAFRSIRPPGR